MSSGKRIAALAAGAAMFAGGPLLAQDGALPEAEPQTEPNRWFSYPSRSMRNGEQGQVGYRLLVGTSGRVESCEITHASIYPALNEATCVQATRRARFLRFPADPKGPGLRVFESQVSWAIAPELVSGRSVTAQDLPRPQSKDGANQMWYRLTIDPEGNATACAIGAGGQVELFNAAACEAIMQIAKDSRFSTGFYGIDGEPVMRTFVDLVVWPQKS